MIAASMKISVRHLLTAAVFTTATSLFAASKPQPNFRPLAIELVGTYLSETKDETDQTWAKFAEEQKLGDQQLAQTCSDTLAMARAVVTAGTPPDSPFFARVLADSLGVKTITPPVATPTPSRSQESNSGQTDGLSDTEFEAEKLSRAVRDLQEKLATKKSDIESGISDPTKKKRTEAEVARLTNELNLNLARQELQKKNTALDAAKKKVEASGATAADRKALEQATVAKQLCVAAVDAFAQAVETPDDMKKTGAVSFFQAGVRQLSPYKLVLDTSTPIKTGKLEKGDGDSVSGFVEYVYSNRWAWNDARIAAGADQPDLLLSDILTNWDADRIDFEGRINVGIAKNSEVDANAIAGSGEIGVEFNLAKHLARGAFDGDDGHYSVSAEIGYGLTTDRNAFDAHQRFFGGLSFTASYPSWGGGDGAVLLNFRGGYTKIDTVRFLDRSSRQIELTHDDLPRYRAKDAWTLEADMIYPLSKNAHMTLGTRITGGLDPNPWTIYVGYTKSIGELAKALLPTTEEKSGGQEKKTSPATTAINPPAN